MKRSNGRLIIGVILVLLGVFYLADNFFFFPWQLRHLVFSWPTILVVIGAIIFVNSGDRYAGLIVMLVGVGLLVFRYYHIPFSMVFREYWPVLLIIFGLLIIFKPRRRLDHTDFGHKFDKHEFKNESGNADTVSDIIDETVIFHGIDRRIHSPSFKGGKITTIFGGAEIDLRDSKLASGHQILDVEVIFGGLDLYVPNDWRVIINVTSIFGAFDDGRRIMKDANLDESRILEIRGVVVFGGGDLKN